MTVDGALLGLLAVALVAAISSRKDGADALGDAWAWASAASFAAIEVFFAISRYDAAARDADASTAVLTLRLGTVAGGLFLVAAVLRWRSRGEVAGDGSRLPAGHRLRSSSLDPAAPLAASAEPARRSGRGKAALMALPVLLAVGLGSYLYREWGTREDNSDNERSVLQFLQNVSAAQAQLQRDAKADVDNDGTGEYGGFIELSGLAAGRMVKALNPPALPGLLSNAVVDGVLRRFGYRFRIFLPDKDFLGVAERASGFAATDVSADLSETTWCLYAWPEVRGKTGTRTFFTYQGGGVFAGDAAQYSGDASPPPGAAFKADSRITGSPAKDEAGQDGLIWRPLP